MALLVWGLGRIKMGVAGEDLLGLHGKRVIIVSDYRRMRVIRLWVPKDVNGMGKKRSKSRDPDAEVIKEIFVFLKKFFLIWILNVLVDIG